jgi:repressor LexA
VKELSSRQEHILQFIERFTRERKLPPTIREIQSALNISSTSVVDYNLKVLEERDLIRRNKSISRGIELTTPVSFADEFVSIPVLGRIAAGEPIPVPDNSFAPGGGESIEVNQSLLKGRIDDTYALRVRGHSMVDALIDDGDIVLLRHQDTAENGQTVAVWLKEEKETTLKKFYQEGDRIRLQPANVTMEPIYTSSANVEIQGRLVAVIRQVA